MNIAEILKDKQSKPKEKIELLSQGLLAKSIKPEALCDYAETAKDPEKGSCIEALEFASKQDPTIVSEKIFEFVTETLSAKAPRIKWESAKVIANTAQLFKNKLENAIEQLLENAAYDGTVVRWSAALALGEIYKLKTAHNIELLPKIEALIEKEEKNSIKKIYQEALKKAAKK